MSNIDKQALRDISESIEREEWEVLDNGDDEYQVIVKGSLEKGETYRSYQPVSNEISERKIAAFIAAFSPATALALLDDLEAAEHTAAVDHEAACSLVEENEEVKRKLAAAEKRIADYHRTLNNLASVARRYLPDYDEHPDIQAADDLLENAATHQGSQLVSNRDELPPDEIECDICGHVSTDPEGRHHCCEDNSND
ncbi:ead/Ea22-like family protein [Citrobacter amalonaticus]|uniref:ead/Ea22-like family protein n=1 Tax=Citrobacter amalonaticus TaxID=35703 RepID=UPI001902F4B6|nr:ead/Ea22-like family protein [Citrobacter amalonaticus]MBJ9080246.1 ead/Ea22-like family protein [Citrobacter amalonaticus]MBW0871037.1 ead/Ea22-like family protein [Citrobacter amalonaticus]